MADRQCTATNRKGTRCGRTATPGATVCVMHGGAAPQVKAAAERRLAEAEAARFLRDVEAELPEDGDPIEVLAAVMSEAWRLQAYWAQRVEALDDPKAPEWVLHERSLERVGKVAAALGRLNLDERVVRLHERHGELIARVISAVLDDLGLGDRRAEVGPLVRRHVLELAS